MFDRNAFTASFEATLTTLAGAEKITKDTLRTLSRDLLFITQESQDIGYINRTLEVLTPMNRKTAVLFFKEFSGFLFGEDTNKFYKKDKKRYEDIVAKATEFLADPHNNIWTWAERNVDVQVKPFDLSKVTAFAKQALNKAEKEGMSQVQVLEAFFAGGVTMDAVMALMDKIAGKQQDEAAEQRMEGERA
ncbi:hypothetical protein WT58_24085 [Burkholderia territorii]|uniref:hypothetical protein n=1 Tax=Burkholderia territorii TaxID=1503055 RepID=UPI000759070F|nr:hypothetical protein [Burkholderia territorii]KWH03715.1 hypothetical protein WT58_24085 [Burkholderia territorii]